MTLNDREILALKRPAVNRFILNAVTRPNKDHVLPQPMEVPKKRQTWTYELAIHSVESGRFKMYMAVGMTPEGRPIEIWLDCAKEGTMLRELMHAWAALFSIALQSGVSLARVIHLYKDWRFEPCGKVEGFGRVGSCQSVVSLVVSVLEAEFPQDAIVDPAQKLLFEGGGTPPSEKR